MRVPDVVQLAGGWRAETARVIFMIDRGEMILLHGFIKKTRKTPASEPDLAKRRAGKIQERR
jgi:phage-related protein